MKNRTFLKKALLPAAAVCSLLASQGVSQTLPAQAQMTTQSGRTLQDLQGGATSEVGSTLQELQDRAAALESERSSRTPVYSGGSVDSPSGAADSPTTEATPTGENEKVIATLSPQTGKAIVVLMNNTGDEVVYEAIGQTAPRTLAAGESTRLEGLPLPVTITAERQNSGLVDMNATVSADGVLNVGLESSEFDAVQGALRISEDGLVFVN